MLKLHNFSYSFGKKPVLESLSFELAAGGHVSVIGPNGAGKSTLLKCLMRLHEQGAQSGEAELKKRPLSSYKQRELARLISYVPQAGGWIPPYTVEEFLRLSRYPYSNQISASEAASQLDMSAIKRALALTSMEKFAGRLLQELSGGERQKAYLAAALAQGGEIMLLDEPTAFLDPKHAADLTALLQKLGREKKLAMLMVTHDLNQALDMGGKVLVLRRGRQIFFGPAERLMEPGILEDTYNHRFSRFMHPDNGRPIIMAEAGAEPPSEPGSEPVDGEGSER